jgi:hypothetical protein
MLVFSNKIFPAGIKSQKPPPELLTKSVRMTDYTLEAIAGYAVNFGWRPPELRQIDKPI